METVPKKLLEIVDMVHSGSVRLPQFQRSFVWTRQEVAELLVSLLNGYYVGTFLWLPVQDKALPFGDRLFEGVNPATARESTQFLILDGQQRLTSLYYALHAPSSVSLKGTRQPYRFYLSLDALPDEDNVPVSEEAVFSERADAKKYSRLEDQYAQRIIPITKLRESELPQWIQGYQLWATQEGGVQEPLGSVLERGARWLQRMRHFLDHRVPVVQLPAVADTKGLEQVATIFEKINSTGQRLSVFDLLTARLYPQNINLRQFWECALEEHEHLGRFVGDDKKESYAVYALRTLALYRGQDARAKRLINLSADGFESDWQVVVNEMNEAAKRLGSANDAGFGAFKKSWVPYTTMISPLAMLLWRAKKIGSPDAYEKVKQWYWASVFTERYAGSVETKMMQDFKEVAGWMHGETVLPDAIREAHNQYRDIDSGSRRILETATTGNSIFRGPRCLLAVGNAKDFFLGDTIAFHDLDVHHIFPASFLKSHLGVRDAKAINSLANQTLIASETNRAISNKAPSAYLRDLEHKHGNNLPRLLAAHFIDEEAKEAMRRDDYEAFVAARSRAIAREVQKRIGLA